MRQGYDPEVFRPRPLDSAAALARFRFQPERFASFSQAVAHGQAIARAASCLVLARWEEGWDRPISDWRAELGIGDPADSEPYGLAHELIPDC